MVIVRSVEERMKDAFLVVHAWRAIVTGERIRVGVESGYSYGRNDANGGVDMRNEINHDLQLVSFCPNAQRHR